MMLTWQGLDVPRLEGVRLVLSERGMRATGALVSPATGDQPAYAATYSLATGETGLVSRVSVRSVSVEGERQVTLNRSEEGNWLIDHGLGAKRTDFDGAADVDVAACVLFNALPVRRLGLHSRSTTCRWCTWACPTCPSSSCGGSTGTARRSRRIARCRSPRTGRPPSSPSTTRASSWSTRAWPAASDTERCQTSTATAMP
jgi:putative glycolipid-binding protein